MAESKNKGADDDKTLDKQTLFAVLKFLKGNNLKGTEALLLREANLKDEDIQAETATQSASDVSRALAAYKSGGDPSLYDDYYTSLKVFVEQSLDVHKCELSTILYPVFVQMYLELVYNGHSADAVKFFEKFKIDQDDYRGGDLNQLSTVTKAEHMSGNQMMENFKSSKFTIRMSRDSYNHLKRHLLDRKQNILLNIVQEHLFIDVFDGMPRTTLQIQSTSGGMCGESRKEWNKAKVYYGLLKEPEISIAADEDEEPTEGDDRPKKKKQKKDMLSSKKAKNDPNSPSASRIPLPEMKDHHRLEKGKALRESTKRVQLGIDSLPSICFYTFLNAHQGLTSVDICEDSSIISAGFADSSIRVFSLTPSKLRQMKLGRDLSTIDHLSDDVLERMMDDHSASDSKILLGHTGPIYATSFTPDRSFMISASADGTLRLWSTATWTNLVCYKGHNNPVWDVKFGPHGHYFASCGHDNTARLWSTDHYQPLRLFTGHLSDVDTVQFHPNSNYLATGSTDRTVRLWDIHNGQCVRHMTGHKARIHTLCFSPCGRYIVSAGADRMVLLWDVASGELIGQMLGHSDSVQCLAYSRDGGMLATGGADNTVALWDMNKIFDEQDLECISPANLADGGLYKLASFATKSTPVLALHFTRRNLLFACGPYTP